MAGESTRLVQLRKGAVEVAVLAVLARGERYGYELCRALEGHGPLAAAEGTVYPLLRRLEGLSLVASEHRPSPAGPARRYYRLTQDGALALRSATVEWRALADAMARVLPDPAEATASA
jgi:PadR family transcriptional regulator PadR